MIYITGDTHIPTDIGKLNSKSFPEQKKLTKGDHLIICGDFGGVWDNSSEEKYWLKWLSEKSFTTLFVDGNHENFTMLKSFPLVKYCGGLAHRIDESIYHLTRGEIFTIDNKSFFAFGGASSHDKEFRKENISWWSEELPSENEFENARKNLEKNNMKLDYVITHCASDSVQRKLGMTYDENKLTGFFEELQSKLSYKKWFFGHYHTDREIDSKHICLFDNIISLG